jgi:hypothetical protein
LLQDDSGLLRLHGGMHGSGLHLLHDDGRHPLLLRLIRPSQANAKKRGGRVMTPVNRFPCPELRQNHWDRFNSVNSYNRYHRHKFGVLVGRNSRRCLSAPAMLWREHRVASEKGRRCYPPSF